MTHPTNADAIQQYFARMAEIRGTAGATQGLRGLIEARFDPRARCPTVTNSEPAAKSLTFRQLEAPDPHIGAPSYRYRYEVARQSATGASVVGHLNFGSLTSPMLLSVFVAGCFLIDQPAAWRCTIMPMFRNVRFGDLGPRDPDDYDDQDSDPVIANLARMLGATYVASSP